MPSGGNEQRSKGSGRVSAAHLADGEELVADLVIVGIGIQPNVALARKAGLIVNGGLDIDANSRTSDPDIFAAGDCGVRVRLEAVSSAVEQAEVAAATKCGRSEEIAALPWFWSDQYDLKLQIAGLNTGYDQVVLRGDPAVDREFACFYLRRGELIAADCVNRPQEFMFGKRAISSRLPVDPARLADLAVPIADQLKSAAAVVGCVSSATPARALRLAWARRVVRATPEASLLISATCRSKLAVSTHEPLVRYDRARMDLARHPNYVLPLSRPQRRRIKDRKTGPKSLFPELRIDVSSAR